MANKWKLLLAVGVAALVIAAGVLGYLAWRGREKGGTASSGREQVEAAGGLKSDTNASVSPMQIGLNFIRFYWDDERANRKGSQASGTAAYVQPDHIFDDFKALGVQGYRQFIKADLMWDIVEPQDNQWKWEAPDSVIKNREFTPIVTLFRTQYASPNPPWAAAGDAFQKTLGPEAKDYLEKVIERYGDHVKYWELGNEMDHWRATDAGGAPRQGRNPGCWPKDGFSPQEQGAFLAQTAQFIRDRDPDAVIVMPGMAGLSDYCLNTWLKGVIEGGGSSFFDVVNYHYYGSWANYGGLRDNFTSVLAGLGIAGKPVWCTETGSTASATLTVRTNYPNSPESQAADIFRRIVQAYGHGDSYVSWHTYISSGAGPNNDWREYGILTDKGEPTPSYYAFKLLTGELIPFKRVETLSADPGGGTVYKVTTGDGGVKYVAWGSGAFAVPGGVTRTTSVIAAADGSYSWAAASPGATVQLSANPVLMK